MIYIQGRTFYLDTPLEQVDLSTLVSFGFKDRQWSEYIEIFLDKYYLAQLYQPPSQIAKLIHGTEALQL
ncbi:hypothetical protein EMIT0P100_110154 [Pseudomonas sp. IT-P100]